MAKRAKGVLRADATEAVKEIVAADIVIGIPALNNEGTIAHVVRSAGRGVNRFFPSLRAVVVVSDNGSVDDTREVALSVSVPKKVRKIVTIYRGMRGKGTAFRAIFEIAKRLQARACVVVDSDLRSITPEWIRLLATPVLKEGYGYVTPFYRRHKYDGTITNNIAYPLTRALYGLRIRQPIGGDFAMCGELARFYSGHEVWNAPADTSIGRMHSAVSQFGIDVWMTTSAVNEGFKVCQAALGVKLHDPKDPGSSLGPMFRQVVGSLFGLMGIYEERWKQVGKTRTVPVVRGDIPRRRPEAVAVNHEQLLMKFQAGYLTYRDLWSRIISRESMKRVRACMRLPYDRFELPPELWVKIIYDFAVACNRKDMDRVLLLDSLTPLYFGRVASFVAHTAGMSESDAERVVEAQARTYEELKPCLVRRWGK